MTDIGHLFKTKTLIALSLSAAILAGCGKTVSNTAVYERELKALDDNKDGQIILQSQSDEESSDGKALYFDEENDINYRFLADGKYITVYDGEKFEPVYLNGVNIGSGYPGHFPGEFAISKEVYLSWFDKIAAMNCNCIRVYTMMKPDFYDALYEYNENNENKLFLLMGLWYNEEELLETSDAFSTLNDSEEEAKRIIDAVHGNAIIDNRPGAAYGKYTSDISEYVLGWIIGIEMDPEFIAGTNAAHPDMTGYDGKYLRTANKSDISAFDTFQCRLADEIIAYEADNYQMIRPVSWINWPTTDPLSHPVEPYNAWEDVESINVENIKAKDNFPVGIFASYHIYPYYPEFMTLEDKYTTYRDKNGKINTYEAYIKEIKSFHSIPVLIAEFGVPTSRGCTNANHYMHYDQGHITEDQQAVYLANMAESIHDSGCCGGIAFSWQDEWFKRTWNTMDYSEEERRAFWSDIQTSEQSYGIMTFDPGKEKTIVSIDGSSSDWEDATEIVSADGAAIMAKSDARYLYLCIKKSGLDPENARFVIPFDITPKSGSKNYNSFKLDMDADFVLDINGKDDTRILVHSYYDRYAFAFGAYDNMFDSGRKKKRIRKSSKEFVPIYLCLSRKQIIERTKEVIDAERMETGKLKYGIGEPFMPDYNSLSDFCGGKGFLEFRIPWGLLSFRDPSTKLVEDDFWIAGKQQPLEIEGIKIGLGRVGEVSVSGEYTWDNWEQTDFYERPKKAYFLLGEKYKELKLD